MLGLLFSDPRTFVLVIFALIISITIHEFAHAFVADKLGDPTARALGRVTLDPRAHLDPLGTILLIVAGFGWGRPVPFDPSYLKNPKKDSALIALAGPVSNFLLAILLTFLFKTFYKIKNIINVFLLRKLSPHPGSPLKSLQKASSKIFYSPHINYIILLCQFQRTDRLRRFNVLLNEAF